MPQRWLHPFQGKRSPHGSIFCPFFSPIHMSSLIFSSWSFLDSYSCCLIAVNFADVYVFGAPIRPDLLFRGKRIGFTFCLFVAFHSSWCFLVLLFDFVNLKQVDLRFGSCWRKKQLVGKIQLFSQLICVLCGDVLVKWSRLIDLGFLRSLPELIIDIWFLSKARKVPKSFLGN